MNKEEEINARFGMQTKLANLNEKSRYFDRRIRLATLQRQAAVSRVKRKFSNFNQKNATKTVTTFINAQGRKSGDLDKYAKGSAYNSFEVANYAVQKQAEILSRNPSYASATGPKSRAGTIMKTIDGRENSGWFSKDDAKKVDLTNLIIRLKTTGFPLRETRGGGGIKGFIEDVMTGGYTLDSSAVATRPEFIDRVEILNPEVGKALAKNFSNFTYRDGRIYRNSDSVSQYEKDLGALEGAAMVEVVPQIMGGK